MDEEILSQYQNDLITEFFQYVDIDGDGYITADEIKMACMSDAADFKSEKEGIVYFRDFPGKMTLEYLHEFNRAYIYSKKIRISPQQ